MNNRPTIKPRTKYVFATSNNVEEEEQLNNTISYFYQICIFPVPKTKLYNMRKFVINGKNEFVDIKDYQLTEDQCKKFYDSKKKHEYKCFSTFSLDNVNTPTLNDVNTAKSNILTNEYSYTGFAPF